MKSQHKNVSNKQEEKYSSCSRSGCINRVNTSTYGGNKPLCSTCRAHSIAAPVIAGPILVLAAAIDCSMGVGVTVPEYQLARETGSRTYAALFTVDERSKGWIPLLFRGGNVRASGKISKHPCISLHPELDNLHLHTRVSTVRKENFGKYTSTNSIELGVPFHVAIVMDSRTKTFSLYFNGQLDFCKDLLPGDSFSNSTGPLYFGSCPENPGEKEAWELENVTATITAHSCSIYLKALTSSEISALIAAAVQPSSSAGHSRETHSPTPRDCAASAVANENLSSVCSLVSSLRLPENDSSTCVQPSSSAGHGWETHFPDPRQKTDSSGSWQKAAPTSKPSIASPSNGYNGYNSFNSAAAAAEAAVVSSSCMRAATVAGINHRPYSSATLPRQR